MLKRAHVIFILTILTGCKESPTSPNNPQGSNGDFTVQASSLWDWASSAATDGSNFLVMTWRGDSTITTTFPTAQLGTVSAVLVSSTGSVIASIDLSQTQGEGALVNFDGTNYDVLYADGPAASSTVSLQRISPAGAKVGSPVLVGGGVLTEGIGAGNGTTVVSYAKEGSSTQSAWARVVNSNGSLGNEMQLTTATNSNAGGVAFDGSNFVALYVQGGSQKEIAAKVINSAGQVVRDIPLSNLATFSSTNVVAFNGSNFLAIWSESGNASALHAQAFKADGTLIGSMTTLTGVNIGPRNIVANGANFEVQYRDGATGARVDKIITLSGAGVPIGAPVEIRAADGSLPPVSVVMTAAGSNRLFSAMSLRKSATWDVFGRFVNAP